MSQMKTGFEGNKQEMACFWPANELIVTPQRKCQSVPALYYSAITLRLGQARKPTAGQDIRQISLNFSEALFLFGLVWNQFNVLHPTP